MFLIKVIFGVPLFLGAIFWQGLLLSVFSSGAGGFPGIIPFIEAVFWLSLYGFWNVPSSLLPAFVGATFASIIFFWKE